MARLPIPFSNPATYPGHSGVDFPQAAGTPIPASGDGVVYHRNVTKNGGYQIWVRYSNGTEVGYAHMPSHKACPPVGARVGLRDTLGVVGSTGRSTGPHLHMEINGDASTAGFWRHFTSQHVVGDTPEPKPKPITVKDDEMALFILERRDSQKAKSIYDPVSGKAGRQIGVDENTSFRKGQAAGAVVYVTVSDKEYKQRGGKG